MKAESGYDPGTLSQTTVTLSGPIAFTATEATDWTGKPKFTVNKNNNKGPFYLKIGSDWYKLKYTNSKSEDSEVFDFIFMIIAIGFCINIDYCDATTDGSITTKAITKMQKTRQKFQRKLQKGSKKAGSFHHWAVRPLFKDIIKIYQVVQR